MGKNRILIIEDEIIIALNIQKKLESKGFEVLDLYTNGEDVVSEIDSLQPDLILADIKLQGEMDGISTIQKIKEKYDIPFIYITAHCDEEILERAEKTMPEHT